MSFRSIPDDSICAPEHNGDATLVALRLENNYINPQKVSPTAFSCVRSSSSVVLKPQKAKWSGITHDKNKDTLTQLSQTIFCIITKKKNLKIYSPHLPCSMMCVVEIQHKVKGKKAVTCLTYRLNTEKKESVYAIMVAVICLLRMCSAFISLDWLFTRCIRVRFYCSLSPLRCYVCFTVPHEAIQR